MAATTDNPDAAEAFEDLDWHEELASQTPHTIFFIAELDDGAPRGPHVVNF